MKSVSLTPNGSCSAAARCHFTAIVLSNGGLRRGGGGGGTTIELDQRRSYGQFLGKGMECTGGEVYSFRQLQRHASAIGSLLSTVDASAQSKSNMQGEKHLCGRS
jgi:hypothetical protein